MPPKKSVCFEGTFDAPIDGASFYPDKVLYLGTFGLPTVSSFNRAEENKRSVVTIGGNRSLSVKVKDTDTSNIKERKALEK